MTCLLVGKNKSSPLPNIIRLHHRRTSRLKVHSNSPTFCIALILCQALICQIIHHPSPQQSQIPRLSQAFQQPTPFIQRHSNKFYHHTFINPPLQQHRQRHCWNDRSSSNSGANNNNCSHRTKSTLLHSAEPSSAEKVETNPPPTEQDVPTLTEAGGYTHTKASKAKISAANKGKTPWNKGKTRSEEVKARIAEGVRRKNRERFLKKLEDLGLTEEEYEQQKKEERRQKDAERRARKTANGGYKLTDETKKKISKALKEKHASGQVKKREYKGPFRKGFSHSEETKQKIRETLKRKWAEDPEYQEKMKSSSAKNNSTSSRAKISKTLKEKWQDPEFREKMIKAMKSTKRKSSPKTTQSQREKISAAMKKKWQNQEYRNKAMKGMEAYRESLPPKPKRQVSKAASTIKIDNVSMVTPIKNTKTKRKTKSSVRVASTSAAKKKKPKAKKKKKSKKSSVELAETATTQILPNNSSKSKSNGKTKEKKDDGDISRMREERRDLYDLLYGDEPEDLISDHNHSHAPLLPDPLPESGSSVMAFFGGGGMDLDDDNLDDFDPYGLDDN